MSTDTLQHAATLLPSANLQRVAGECAAHGPREVVVRVGLAWYCPACLEAQLKAEADQRWKRERREHLHVVAAIPAKFRGKQFTATSPAQKLARGTAKAFRDEIAKSLRWAVLALVGEPGTGKTLLACELAASLVDNLGMSVRYATAQTMISEIQATYGADGKSEEAEIARYARYDLLIIDEIDAKRSSANADMLLTEIVNRRYNAELPVVVITNQAIASLGKFVGDRVADRLHENAFVCAFDWPSFRRAA
jgi:DNA replication protein DnaC